MVLEVKKFGNNREKVVKGGLKIGVGGGEKVGQKAVGVTKRSEIP